MIHEIITRYVLFFDIHHTTKSENPTKIDSTCEMSVKILMCSTEISLRNSTHHRRINIANIKRTEQTGG